MTTSTALDLDSFKQPSIRNTSMLAQGLEQCSTDCLRVVLEVRVVFAGLDRTFEGAVRPSSRLE